MEPLEHKALAEESIEESIEEAAQKPLEARDGNIQQALIAVSIKHGETEDFWNEVGRVLTRWNWNKYNEEVSNASSDK